MKIYTKTGDKGFTGLIGGARVSKCDVRVEAYGTVDELNASVGVLRTKTTAAHHRETLLRIQQLLFDLGSVLAAGDAKKTNKPELFEQGISMLEQAMDDMSASLPVLTEFVLPGGSEAGALCHVCRTIARRAERRMWKMHEWYAIDDKCLIFINRLSDFFFILSRKLTVDEGIEEIFRDVC